MLRIEPGSTTRAAVILTIELSFQPCFEFLRIHFILFVCVLVSHSANSITQLLIMLKESLVKLGEYGTNYLKLVFPIKVTLTRPLHLWFLDLDYLVCARSLYLTLQGFLRPGNKFLGIPNPMTFIHGYFSTEPWKWRFPLPHLKFLNLHCFIRTTCKSHSLSLTAILSPRPTMFPYIPLFYFKQWVFLYHTLIPSNEIAVSSVLCQENLCSF